MAPTESEAAGAPLVSIVVATFNGSHLLPYAIGSVLRGTMPDWEMIVVGDCCTDDTEAVVAGFDDPRISFVNLAENSGQQSVPNNVGVGLARGRYVAFLNQDDMYFPDHLAACVAELTRTRADLVWVPCALPRVSAPEDLAQGRWQAELWGPPRASGYSPFSFQCASSWVFQRALSERIGPWRHHHDVYVTPSQDWLFRAWKSGARLECLPHVTVLLIPSGLRKDSYVNRTTCEHEYFADQMASNPRFREQLMESAAINTARSSHEWLYHDPVAGIRRGLTWPLYAGLARRGIHPRSLDAMVRFRRHLRPGRKGELIESLRNVTGLDGRSVP